MHTPVTFKDLESAFWRHVAENCPHPTLSRSSVLWIRDNPTFLYHGLTYTRRTSLMTRGAAGKGSRVAVAYHGPNDFVVEQPGTQGSASLYAAQAAA
jgi:hypothetical protein